MTLVKCLAYLYLQNDTNLDEIGAVFMTLLKFKEKKNKRMSDVKLTLPRPTVVTQSTGTVNTNNLFSC